MGVAGDMMIAALLDVGADEAHVRAQLATLELPGWQLSVETVTRAALRASAVTVTHDEHHHHRSWSTIDAMLDAAARTASLSAGVASGARRTFRELAVAEATVLSAGMVTLVAALRIQLSAGRRKSSRVPSA